MLWLETAGFSAIEFLLRKTPVGSLSQYLTAYAQNRIPVVVLLKHPCLSTGQVCYNMGKQNLSGELEER
jgi:hypothetical protein